MNQSNKILLKISFGIFIALLFLAGLILSIVKFSNDYLSNLLLIAVLSVLITIPVVLLLVVLLFISRKDNQNKFLISMMLLFYPLIRTFSKALKQNSDELDKIFIEINNRSVRFNLNKEQDEKIVVLLPHCLQDNSCKIKITDNIDNCARCGKCDISAIVEMKNHLSVTALVVTGGTAARNKLSKIKPTAVVAVACERDLSSGINDVKGVPIIGVLNMRPNGPCCNTKVDINAIKEAILEFKG